MTSFLLKRVAEWGQVSGGMVTCLPPTFQRDGGLCGPPASPSHLQPTLPGPCLLPAWMSVEWQDGEGAQSAAFTNGTASRNGILVRLVERKIS